ncbi:MAG: transcriptional repressor [Candidatus Woesearchaeota archaeon]
MPKKRKTIQKALLTSIIEQKDTFFSADELHALALKKDKTIGIATVYRFLKEAKKQGILHSYSCNRKTIYSKQSTSHCHFICEATGKVIHFEIDSIDFLKDKIPGTIKSFQLEVRGYCTDHQSSCPKH